VIPLTIVSGTVVDIEVKTFGLRKIYILRRREGVPPLPLPCGIMGLGHEAHAKVIIP